jgi:hypothetical protein
MIGRRSLHMTPINASCFLSRLGTVDFSVGRRKHYLLLYRSLYFAFFLFIYLEIRYVTPSIHGLVSLLRPLFIFIDDHFQHSGHFPDIFTSRD